MSGLTRAERSNRPTFSGATTFEQRTDYGFAPNDRPWSMESHERLALLAFLNWLKPDTAIEIGVQHGGSLAAIATHARRVFAFDIDPQCAMVVKQFPNVSLALGPSRERLPQVLKQLAAERAELEFILIDGDHSADGVRTDVECFLSYAPRRPCYVLLHDSFNPSCRQGMIDAAWTSSPFVHRVELDFVPGRILDPTERDGDRGLGRQMWGGFALAILRPERRQGPVELLASGNFQFQTALNSSSHRRQYNLRRILGPAAYGRLKTLLGFARGGTNLDRLRRLINGTASRA